MGHRITVYAIPKKDYKRNLGKMNDDKLEDVLYNSKKILRLDRKGISAIVAKNLGISAGNAKKVSFATGKKLSSAMNKGMHIAVKDMAEQRTLTMGDVGTLVGSGLVVEAFTLTSSNRLYGGYFVIYA